MLGVLAVLIVAVAANAKRCETHAVSPVEIFTPRLPISAVVLSSAPPTGPCSDTASPQSSSRGFRPPRHVRVAGKSRVRKDAYDQGAPLELFHQIREHVRSISGFMTLHSI